jgi:hypothetical protein
MREKREKELSEPKMQELKKEALEFFHKWQESVISRVGRWSIPRRLQCNSRRSLQLKPLLRLRLHQIRKVLVSI